MSSDPVLVPLVPQAADEGIHQPDADILWSESHYLDAVAPGAGAGVYARIGRVANKGSSHVTLAVVRPGAGPVIIADAGAPLPAIDGIDLLVTADDYRLGIAWDERLGRVRVTADGTATAYHGQADILHKEPGRPVTVQADLVWETDGTPFRWRRQTRYEIPCRVRGQVTVDGERTEIDWIGQRDHSWGQRDWWGIEWNWAAVHLEDGTRWHWAAVPAYPPAGTGYFQLGNEVTEATMVAATTTFTPAGLFETTSVRIEPGGHVLDLTPVAFAPVRFDAEDGRLAFFPRATCTVVTDDGRRGIGWVEWNLLR
jgi:hypothetical protein